jgi:predicted small secreted protein
MKLWTSAALMLLGLFAVLALPACHTIRGMGEDVEEAGEEIQEETY